MVTLENTKTIYDLVVNSGSEYSDRTFLRYEIANEVIDISYKDFSKLAMSIGAWTGSQDNNQDRPIHIGIIGGTSYQYIATLLGVMTAGVVVPLDEQLTSEAFCENVNRADVDALFFDWKHHEMIESAKTLCPNVKRYICLNEGYTEDTFEGIIDEYEGKAPANTVKPEELAMILFTSGTTGRGKGVMLSQGNIIDNVFCTDSEIPNPQDDICLSVLPLHHVFCINGDILLVMKFGCVVCLNQDLALLATHLQLFKPTVIRVVPMMAKALMNKYMLSKQQRPRDDEEDIRAEVFGENLSRIVSGGGYLPVELANKYKALGILIGQGYGMSECSPKISTPDYARPDKAESVGKLVRGCQIRIVDGEIQVKSPSVMMGYYKDPELTSEALTEDGFLCTGDLGYVDGDNYLYLTGRKKNLIILSNGENVAPEQLENLFEGDRLVDEIMVYGQDDVIVAEIYPNYKYAQLSGISDIEEELNKLIKRHNEMLPSFKKIAKLQLRESPFEKTSSKKIKRNIHIEQNVKKAEEQARYKKPETDIQKKLYELVAAVLGKTDFGIDTNFYDAGMDSMGSVMLLSELCDAVNLNITLGELMENASVIMLEAMVLEQKEKDAVDLSKRDVYPLTNLQMYFAYVLRGNTTANLPFLFRLDKRVDLERLKKAVDGVFDVHPELKCVIRFDEGAFKNFRHDEFKVDIPIETLDADEWRQTREKLVHPFMYGDNDPLYHAGIYITPEDNYFFLDVAHIMGDGMSMNIIFQDINRLYNGEKLEPEKYTFYEYILDEKAREAKGAREGYIGYYKKLLDGAVVKRSILNLKKSRDLSIGEDGSIRERFSLINRNKVAGFCKTNGISENVFFLTVFNYCISLFQNEADSISSSIHSGRVDSRWNRITGPLFITYHYRWESVAHETVVAMLKRSGKEIMDTMKCLISSNHADEMFFQYQGDILGIDTIGGYPARRQRIQLDALPFHLQVFWDKDGYLYELRFWENRFDRKQLEIFMKCYEDILDAIISEENSARRLREHLSREVFPIHFTVKAGVLNKDAGEQLIYDCDDAEDIKVYVLNKSFNKQPFGGWGDLYICNHPTAGFIDKIKNPYSEGTLYKTGRTARILPDGSVDFVENGGRTIIQEFVAGRKYLDLYKLEKALEAYDGIDRADAYTEYSVAHQMILVCDVYGKEAPDEEAVKEYIKNQLGETLTPAAIKFYKTR